jgi:hypothetical protein
MLTEIAYVLSNLEQYVCCYRDGEIYLEPVTVGAK